MLNQKQPQNVDVMPVLVEQEAEGWPEHILSSPTYTIPLYILSSY